MRKFGIAFVGFFFKMGEGLFLRRMWSVVMLKKMDDRIFKKEFFPTFLKYSHCSDI